MNLQGQRNLFLLSEVERDAGITQRSLAGKLGVALGLTNLYLKRLARKGHIKITTIPKHRIQYLLTPQGFAEKSRLTYLYMQYSLSYYRQMRQRLKDVLLHICRTGATRIAIYGTGELAELGYLCLLEMNLTLVAFVDGKEGQSFLSYPVLSVEALAALGCDAVVIAELEDVPQIQSHLVSQGISKKKIFSLSPRS